MFVITADQVDSRHSADLVEPTIAQLSALAGTSLVLPVDRTAGDELQLIVADGPIALSVLLALTRHGQWSVGCGIGTVATPLPRDTRAATGPAFVAARSAVEAAKKRESRFALRSEGAASRSAEDLEAVIDLLLLARSRRSPQGWELYDLMTPGTTQAQAAEHLGITPQAASKRARAGAIRAEIAAVSALGHMLAAADWND